MEYYLLMTAANTNNNSPTSIEEILNSPNPLNSDETLIEHAIQYTNESTAYKREGKKIELVELVKNQVLVKLITKNPLDTPSRSLSGFTRELLKSTDALDPFIYNRSLFQAKLVSAPKNITPNVLSDIDYLHMCIDLFTNNFIEKNNALRVKSEISTILDSYNKQLHLNQED